jgi:hypothetical protein
VKGRDAFSASRVVFTLADVLQRPFTARKNARLLEDVQIGDAVSPATPLLPLSEVAAAVHHELLGVCQGYRQAEHRAAALLARVHAEVLHRELGFTSAVHYAETALGLGRRQARALLRIGRVLPDLPALHAAFAAGDLGWTKAREVVRVAIPSTEAAWVVRAGELSSRDLEAEVARAMPGDLPPTHVGHREEAPARTRFVLENVATVDVGAIRDAILHVRATTGVSSDEVGDGEILAQIAQRFLASVADEETPTTERYRVIVEHCPSCRTTAGVDAALTETIASEALCDAEVVEMRPGPQRGHLSHTVPPARRRAVLARDRHRCVVPGCGNRVFRDVHHQKAREHGGTHEEINLATVCSSHHRLIHDGRLSLERIGDEWVVELASGRRSRAPTGDRSRIAPPSVRPSGAR